MIEVHIPANLFFPDLPGGCNQYFRYGPNLPDFGVRLIVHTAFHSRYGSDHAEVNQIEIHRYQLPEGLSILEELEELTERAITAIEKSTQPCVLHPLGTSGASFRSVKRLWRARRMGIPVCFHFMMVPMLASEGMLEKVKEAIRIWFGVTPYQKMLMCSHRMGRAFQKIAWVSRDRIRVIPNGIDVKIFRPVDHEEKTRLRRELGLPEDSRLVLYVGSVIERKGVEVLLEAWDRISITDPGCKLIMVGSNEPRVTLRAKSDISDAESYLERVANQVESMADPDSVVFVGETAEIWKYYQASDIFAFASRREGLPSVILEAMACGLPCVSAPFLGLPADGEEYGVSGQHFLRSSHEPEVLAADLIELLKNEEKRRGIGDQAVEWISRHQEMRKASAYLAQCYHEMVGQKFRRNEGESVV